MAKPHSPAFITVPTGTIQLRISSNLCSSGDLRFPKGLPPPQPATRDLPHTQKGQLAMQKCTGDIHCPNTTPHHQEHWAISFCKLTKSCAYSQSRSLLAPQSNSFPCPPVCETCQPRLHTKVRRTTTPLRQPYTSPSSARSRSGHRHPPGNTLQ